MTIDWSQLLTADQIAKQEELRLTPNVVTMAQCRLALFDMCDIKTDEQFYGIVDVLPEDMRARALLELRTRPTVSIDHPLVVAACEANTWDRVALFTYAAKQ